MQMAKFIFILVFYALPFVFISVEMLNRKPVARTLGIINVTNLIAGLTFASIWVVSESDGFSQMFGAMFIGFESVALSIFSVIYYLIRIKRKLKKGSDT
jgi:quinol-cytochrome oxidoreductase complex cytochrome b subunit